jgi:hypothetical protein
MRSKEYAFDYRYFPEPDLPPVEPDPEWIERIRESIPELPAARRARFASSHGLTPVQVRVLAGSRAWADLFEEAVSMGTPAALAANWLTQDVAALVNESRTDLASSRLTAKHLADLAKLLEAGTVSSTGAKAVLAEAFANGTDAEAIVEERGLRQVSDVDALGAVLARQRRPLVRALAPADDQHARAGQLVEVDEIARVDAVDVARPVGNDPEAGDARGGDDGAGGDGVAGGQRRPPARLERHHLLVAHLDPRLRLEPVRVLHIQRDRDRVDVGGSDPAHVEERVERQLLGLVEVPVRPGAQEHPPRHVLSPEAHRPAEDHRFDPVLVG